MKFLRNIVFFRVYWIVMTLHVFNVTLDYPDELEDPISNELAQCEDKTVLELALDVLIQIENSVGEFGDENTGGKSTFDSSNLYFQTFGVPLPPAKHILKETATTFYGFSYKEKHITIVSPPPKA